MIYSSDLRTVLVHFDAVADDSRWSPDRRPATIMTDAQSARMRWYLEWTAEGARNVFALVPDHFDANEDGLFDKSRPDHVVRYGDEGNFSLSIPRRRGYAFIVNGRQFPIVQWRRAIAAAKRPNADVLAFDRSASAQTHYPVRAGGCGRPGSSLQALLRSPFLPTDGRVGIVPCGRGEHAQSMAAMSGSRVGSGQHRLSCSTVQRAVVDDQVLFRRGTDAKMLDDGGRLNSSRTDPRPGSPFPSPGVHPFPAPAFTPADIRPT